ncbi:hypothetical protein [Endozoicomonas sp. YOMI1]|uniref:hypothetical protein n=1 Tax=Endozoicomonas sp. YOMI1 TaxID=2828739 RepID=UPI00214857A4|nr:hypothetical protein [Endozoicomonas sp. YOMI1]
MDIFTCSAYLNAVSNPLSYFQDAAFSEPGASNQVFSREVAEAADIQCAMRTDETTENWLQQPTVSFRNPSDDLRFEKRSIVIVYSHTKEDQPLHLPVRIEPQNNDHTHTYIPDNERFSIQSILELGHEIRS